MIAQNQYLIPTNKIYRLLFIVKDVKEELK